MSAFQSHGKVVARSKSVIRKKLLEWTPYQPEAVDQISSVVPLLVNINDDNISSSPRLLMPPLIGNGVTVKGHCILMKSPLENSSSESAANPKK